MAGGSCVAVECMAGASVTHLAMGHRCLHGHHACVPLLNFL